jgi:hypothetical protein
VASAIIGAAERLRDVDLAELKIGPQEAKALHDEIIGSWKQLARLTHRLRELA